MDLIYACIRLLFSNFNFASVKVNFSIKCAAATNGLGPVQDMQVIWTCSNRTE